MKMKARPSPSRISSVSPLLLIATLFLLPKVSAQDSTVGKKIAIIGGGIGGTFTTKYLSDLDPTCSIDSITIFDPFFQPDMKKDGKPQDVIPYSGTNDVQRSRVSSFVMSGDDGTTSTTVVELGASILYDGNRLAVEMIEQDDELSQTKPHSGAEEKINSIETLRHGMGIYNGVSSVSSSSPFVFSSANMTKEESKSYMIWRYNLDLYRVNQATELALTKFEQIYDLLDDRSEDTFLDSPDAMWKKVDLDYVAHVSLDRYLDEIGVDGGGSLSWWRKIVNHLAATQGLFREEMFEAMNLVNNNKNNAQMTALAGLVNFIASKGELFAVKGGNSKLMQSAYKQATLTRRKVCSNGNTIQHMSHRVKTVVSKAEEGMELFDAKGAKLGIYDIVILAAPLQFCGISFLVQGSMFDETLLHNMPLNGLVDGEDSDANEHGHEPAWGKGYLPDSASRPYTQVVTTVISHGVLSSRYFDPHERESQLPRSIIFTEKGRESLDGVFTSIMQLTSDGTYKVFSPEELSDNTVQRAFGDLAKKEHVEFWGGKKGGATPDFNGGGDSSVSTQFLLFDADHSVGGSSTAPALYYVSAMEAAVSAIEISAIGAKAVAKLVAKRLELVTPKMNTMTTDEL